MTWHRTAERGSLSGMRFVAWSLRTLGLWPARRVVDLVVLYFFLTGGSARRASLDYLRRVRAFPGGSERLGRGPSWWHSWLHFRTFGQMGLDRVAIWSGLQSRFEVDFPHQQLLLDLDASGRGALLLGAHLGSFDVLRALATRRGRRVRFLMFQHVTPKMNALLRSMDPDLESHVIQLDRDDPTAVLELQKHIESGTWIAILADRKELASERRVGRASLLGHPVELPQSPLLLAALLGCPVYFVYGLRTGSRSYEVVAERLAERITIDRRHRERDLQTWLERYAAHLESMCLRAPLQWFNFYEFWGSGSGATGGHAGRSSGPGP